MSAAGYANRCIGMLSELNQSLLGDEETQSVLLRRLGEIGWKEWEAWRISNATAVSGFVGATPKRQQALLRAQAEPLLLQFAAIQFLAEAAGLLRAADRIANSIGLSYRDVAELAGSEFARLSGLGPAYSPEDFLDLPDWTHIWPRGISALLREEYPPS